MRTPKFTAKRVVGLTAAAALAIAGTVAVAGTSQAAVQTLKVNKVNIGPAANQVIAVTGKDFQTVGGASKIGRAYFSANACTAGAVTPPQVAIPDVNLNVISDTRVSFATPSLATLTPTTKGAAIYLCIQNASGTHEVVGSAKLKLFKAPVINTTGGGVTATTGPVLGGSSISITGENFSTKTTATIGGKALTGVKVVLGADDDDSGNAGDDVLTGMVPAGTGIDKAIVVRTDGGTATSTSDFDYLDAVKVSPSFGDGTLGRVITVAGLGFDDRNFATTLAADTSVIKAVPAGTNFAAASTFAAVNAVTDTCTAIQVVSDTELTCQLPDLTGAANAGPYTIQVITAAPAATAVSEVSAISRASTYTVAAF